MSRVQVKLPAMGEGIIDATITRWLVALGDAVEKDKPIVEIATDKVDSEIDAPVDGILGEIIYSDGEMPKVGEVVAVIYTEASDEQMPDVVEDDSEAVDQLAGEYSGEQKIDEAIITPIIHAPQAIKANVNTDDNIPVFVRYLAKSRGVEYEELLKIEPTGPEGKLSREDVTRYLLAGRPFKRQVQFDTLKMTRGIEKSDEEYNPLEGETVVEMDRTRKIIAEHMVRSKHIAPHVTSTVEVDVTDLVNQRNQLKDIFQKQHESKLTFTPILVDCVAHAIVKYPKINVSVWNDKVILKRNVNIGVATALNDGNLVVPVIKNADRLNLVALSKSVSELASRARANALKPDEIKNGTFTITNIGQFGNITGTPIINQPEVAILAAGVITKKPAVVEVEGQLTIGIRDILVLSMSYDHRIVDGALGGMFLKEVADRLQKYKIDL